MTLGPGDHVVVVGAGLAGWRTCEELRRHGFSGRLTLVGDEAEAPYDRPPLSKQVLRGKWGVEHTTLATAEKIAQNQVELHLDTAASGLDAARTTVRLAHGGVVAGTHVVVATGARARRTPWYSAGLYELRTRRDAERLVARLSALSPGDVVVVIGAGFIGAEVATALHERGLRPVVLESSTRPLLHVLGTTVAQWLAPLASAAGIELRTEQRIVDVAVGDGGRVEVAFDSGESLPAAAAVVGVGAQPNVEWLDGSGLLIDNGVVVDEHHMAGARVAAVGDVARFPYHGELARIEHWQVATDHASALARYWTTGDDGAPLVPYFWSDQYGKKIQMLGHPRADDEVTKVKETPDGHWLGLYHRAGRVTGLVALSQPRALMLSRGLLEHTTSLTDALARAPWAT